jgi:hypothetical protein
MAEDLKRANASYQKLLAEAKTKKGFDKLINQKAEMILYMFYLAGFLEGSGMTQEIIA